jgi:hypothetical protein
MTQKAHRTQLQSQLSVFIDKMTAMKRCVSLIVLYIIFSISTAHAQIAPLATSGLVLSASPNNPSPGQMVTITARSYSANIDSAKITWSVNGETVQNDVGITKLEVKAPQLGQKLKIIATAITTGGTNLTNSITIGSGSVDLIVETDGYVPPMFRGKMPVVYQNSYKIIAIPHIADSSGVEYDPETLVYKWKRNGQAIENLSGYGKQSIILTGEIVPQASSISVTVSPRDNSSQAIGTVTISFVAPLIGFYVDDPLYGPLFNKSIGNSVNIGSEKETSVLMVPFGFNKPNNSNGDLVLTWLINNVRHPELTMNESVVLRAPDGLTGSSNIQLSVRNNKQILQNAQAGFSVVFKDTDSSPQNTTVTF